jgi:hypothetical protein
MLTTIKYWPRFILNYNCLAYGYACELESQGRFVYFQHALERGLFHHTPCWKQYSKLNRGHSDGPRQ